jgi:hypothetical protein
MQSIVESILTQQKKQNFCPDCCCNIVYLRYNIAGS